MDLQPSANQAYRQKRPVGLFAWLTGLLLLCGALCAGGFWIHGIQLVLFPFDIDNSEAYLVYQGQRLAEGSFLYPPLTEPPYLVDNYPPMYPLALAAVFAATGPNFHWPRLLSLTSTGLTALVIGLWVFKKTKAKPAAILAGLAYMCFYHVYDWGALGRVDALGVLFSVIGLYTFSSSDSWKKSVLFFVLALFTRQTLFAAPLAVFCALLFTHRKKEALQFALWLAGSCLLLFGVLMGLSSGRAWSHLVTYNANIFQPIVVWGYTKQWFYMYSVWGVVPFLFLLLRKHAVRSTEPPITTVPLLFGYICFSIGEMALCGKIGSAPNYLLSLVCATSLGLGFLFHRLIVLWQKTSASLLKRSLTILFMAACVYQLFLVSQWMRYLLPLGPSQTEKSAGIVLQRTLSNVDSPILSDLAGVPLLAGHPPVFQPFICSQLSHQGIWDQSLILDRIARQEFTKAVLRFDLSQPDWDRERFTPEMIEALRKAYTLERQIHQFYLYKPR
jgi:hypothetical protein